jgi:hypothetical protein
MSKGLNFQTVKWLLTLVNHRVTIDLPVRDAEIRRDDQY